MLRRMVLGEVVSAIIAAALPVEVELFLVDTVAEPEVSHVKGFGSFESDVGVKDTVGCGVVGF